MLVEAALVAAGALLIGIGVSAYRAFKTRHVTVARALASAKRVLVVDFEEGKTAMIVGKVVAGPKSVEAPLSGKSCVYYRLLVEGPDLIGKEREVVHEAGEGEDFFVEDDSGRARVCVADALVSLAKQRIDWQDAVRAEVDRLLPSERITKRDLRRMVYYEGRLDEGETVAVRGRGRWKVTAEHGMGATYRQRPKQLHLSAPLYISDRPYDRGADTSETDEA